MELFEKVVKHWSTLTLENFVPVAFISLLIVLILVSNRQEKPFIKQLKLKLQALLRFCRLQARRAENCNRYKS